MVSANIFSKIQRILTVSVVAITGVLALSSVLQITTGTSVSAVNIIKEDPSVTTGPLKDAKDQGSQGNVNKQINTVTNILLFLIGTIAVIAIIIGGIRYTTSNGDASQIKSAKDTIMYACIGLVVAILAYAIVRWVVSAFGTR